eukprot:Lithocolla_globosa_v1_NODE_10758_length_566_cov_25.433852.p1 type:complete len:132 gc:universal NODE_10758_length_566_cov_25.433852:530-135(-)
MLRSSVYRVCAPRLTSLASVRRLSTPVNQDTSVAHNTHHDRHPNPDAGRTWSKSQAPRLEQMKGPRFEVDLELQPLPPPAIDFVAEQKPIEVKGGKVACGGGPLEHPRVYINLDDGDNQTCGYCGKIYVQA